MLQAKLQVYFISRRARRSGIQKLVRSYRYRRYRWPELLHCREERKRYQDSVFRAAAESFADKIERNLSDRDRPDGQTHDRNRRAHTLESLASDVRDRGRR